MEVARLLRQGQLFIEQEQATFAHYFNAIERNSFAIFKVGISMKHTHCPNEC